MWRSLYCPSEYVLWGQHNRYLTTCLLEYSLGDLYIHRSRIQAWGMRTHAEAYASEALTSADRRVQYRALLGSVALIAHPQVICLDAAFVFHPLRPLGNFARSHDEPAEEAFWEHKDLLKQH